MVCVAVTSCLISGFTLLIYVTYLGNVIFRVLNIAMVAFGLYTYRRLFKKLKIGEVYINLGLLMFVLLPMTTLVAATVNYDNMIFLLTPLFLIAVINVLELKEPKFIRYVIFMVLGIFASIIYIATALY